MSNEPTKDVIGEITSLSECELFIFSNFNLEDPTKKEQCSLFKEVKLYEGDPPPELEFDIKRTTERAVQHIDEIAKLINEQKNNKSNFEEDNPELKTKWVWINVNIADESQQKEVIKKISSAFGFEGADRVRSAAAADRFTQQPISVVLNTWDFFQVTLYPYQSEPESEADLKNPKSKNFWKNWGRFAYLEANDDFCLHILLSDFVIFTITKKFLKLKYWSSYGMIPHGSKN